MAPGEVLAYRAVATDRRPGAPAAESDTYMIEIVAAIAVASGGMTLDDEFDGYALTQPGATTGRSRPPMTVVFALVSGELTDKSSYDLPVYTCSADDFAGIDGLEVVRVVVE